MLIVIAGLIMLGTGIASSSTQGLTYPNSIAVLGHSRATGYDSDPNRPGTDVRANSWATGTNPVVRSVYLRILAKNPKIRGHNVNLAQDGATVRELLQQARTLVAFARKPELIVIQIMDNDMVCPASMHDIAGFRRGFVAALRVLVAGAPDSRIFVVSQLGRPASEARALTRDERLAEGGNGPCDSISPTGRLVPRRLARLTHTIERYEAQLSEGCKTFETCRYDNGAFAHVITKHAYLSEDLSHFSIRGEAEAAAVAWTALQRSGLLPR